MSLQRVILRLIALACDTRGHIFSRDRGKFAGGSVDVHDGESIRRAVSVNNDSMSKTKRRVYIY